MEKCFNPEEELEVEVEVPTLDYSDAIYAAEMAIRVFEPLDLGMLSKDKKSMVTSTLNKSYEIIAKSISEIHNIVI